MQNKQKIIRACTVPQSLGFVAGMLSDLQKKYENEKLQKENLQYCHLPVPNGKEYINPIPI